MRRTVNSGNDALFLGELSKSACLISLSHKENTKPISWAISFRRKYFFFVCHRTLDELEGRFLIYINACCFVWVGGRSRSCPLMLVFSMEHFGRRLMLFSSERARFRIKIMKRDWHTDVRSSGTSCVHEWVAGDYIFSMKFGRETPYSLVYNTAE